MESATFLIEATQPGYMDEPADGALRVTVEGGLDEARAIFDAVLNHTAVVLGRPLGHIDLSGIEQGIEVEVGAWKHTFRVLTPA